MHNRATQIDTADDVTCEYIWDTSFSSWLRGDGADKIFWISGKPGSGKSTLMKYIAERDRAKMILRNTYPDHGTWNLLHFFFDFRAAKDLANTVDGLFRSVLYQVICCLYLTPEMLEKYNLDLNNILKSHFISDILDTTTRLMREERLNILLLIDGLDEYQGDVRQLIQAIKNFHERTGIRVCLASRPEPMIETLLKNCPSIRLQNINEKGVQAFIESTLNDVDANFELSLASKTHITTFLQQRAEGVFLWVRFAIERMLEALVMGCTVEEACEAARVLPNDMTSMYHRIIDDLPGICKAEAAFVLRVLEDWSGTMPLETLFLLWLRMRPLLYPSSLCEKQMNLVQYTIRLHGFLGGLVDIKTVSVPTDDFEEYHRTQDIGDAKFEAFRFRDIVSVKKQKLGFERFAAPRSISEVRLLHETLRPYLRENHDRISVNLPLQLRSKYPDHIWHRALIEVTQSVKIGIFQDVLKLALKECGQMTFCDAELCGPKRAVFLDKICRFFCPGKLSSSRPRTEIAFIIDSTRHIRKAIEDNGTLTGDIFSIFADTINSPVFLLRHLPEMELIDLMTRQALSVTSRPWQFDMILALEFRSQEWLHRRSNELIHLPACQKQWMMQRVAEIRIRNRSPEKWNDAHLALEMFFSFLQDGQVNATTLASHMISCRDDLQYHNSFLHHYKDRRTKLAATLDSSIVGEDLSDAVYFPDNRTRLTSQRDKPVALVSKGQDLSEVLLDLECSTCSVKPWKRSHAKSTFPSQFSRKRRALGSSPERRPSSRVKIEPPHIPDQRYRKDTRQNGNELLTDPTLQQITNITNEQPSWTERDIGITCVATNYDLLTRLGVKMENQHPSTRTEVDSPYQSHHQVETTTSKLSQHVDSPSRLVTDGREDLDNPYFSINTQDVANRPRNPAATEEEVKSHNRMAMRMYASGGYPRP